MSIHPIRWPGLLNGLSIYNGREPEDGACHLPGHHQRLVQAAGKGHPLLEGGGSETSSALRKVVGGKEYKKKSGVEDQKEQASWRPSLSQPSQPTSLTRHIARSAIIQQTVPVRPSVQPGTTKPH